MHSFFLVVADIAGSTTCL